MLDDGYTYKAIIKAIGDVGAELNEDMMTRWKAGGYQDYLREPAARTMPDADRPRL